MNNYNNYNYTDISTMDLRSMCINFPESVILSVIRNKHLDLNKGDKYGEKLIHILCEHNYLYNLLEELIYKQIDINSMNFIHNTPIIIISYYIWCENTYIKALNLLLKNGAKLVYEYNDKIYSPLEILCSTSYYNLIRILKEKYEEYNLYDHIDNLINDIYNNKKKIKNKEEILLILCETNNKSKSATKR